jgi:voltage-gated potassium channel
MIKKLWRAIRAEWQSTRILFQESRNALLLFVAILLGGALIFHVLYTFPGTDQHPTLAEGLHANFGLIFFDTILPFPEQWYLQTLFFLIPVLGLVAVVDGVLRFGSALANKQARGQKWQVAMASTYKDHVIICGAGKIGYRVAQELLKLGRDIVAIEHNPQGRFVEKVQEMGIPLILANARRSENLIKAGVQEADAIIPCTDDELTNLDIALDARELNPDIKVVMRMFDSDLAQRVERGFGIHTAFSTSALAAPIFAAAAMRVNVKYSFYLGDELLNLGEVSIAPQSRLIGRTLAELEADVDISVVCYQGQQLTDLHPKPDLRLEAGDEIMVIASLETLRRLNALNTP